MAIGAGEKRPWVIDDSLQIATMMTRDRKLRPPRHRRRRRRPADAGVQAARRGPARNAGLTWRSAKPSSADSSPRSPSPTSSRRRAASSANGSRLGLIHFTRRLPALLVAPALRRGHIVRLAVPVLGRRMRDGHAEGRRLGTAFLLTSIIVAGRLDRRRAQRPRRPGRLRSRPGRELRPHRFPRRMGDHVARGIADRNSGADRPAPAGPGPPPGGTARRRPDRRHFRIDSAWNRHPGSGDQGRFRSHPAGRRQRARRGRPVVAVRGHWRTDMADTYDLIVLGSGPGGYVAAIRASPARPQGRRSSSARSWAGSASTGGASRPRRCCAPPRSTII